MRLLLGRTVEDAIDELKSQYKDVDEWREIRDHGCESGVCHSHIYYGETKTFFDDYEEAVVGYVTDIIGDDGVVDLFQSSGNDITTYKNYMVWTFIEYVSQSVIEDYEEEYLP
tara:strand:+ start:872 stop:1210 length:339 start_codon:yes stop_codon:yes gene_type:complete